MKVPNLKIVSALASLLIPMAASAAVTYVEVPDAGETLGTAQAVPGGVAIITGSLAGSSADLFSFHWGGGAFYVNSVGTAWDSQLFLFDSTGVGVLGNDDGIAFAGPAFLQTAALPAGDYYLGVSGYDYDPRDAANGLMFTTFPYEPVYGPLTGNSLDHWGGGGGGGDYVITFQAVTTDGTPVGDPNPTGTPDGGTTLVLLGMGMSGLAWARRKIK